MFVEATRDFRTNGAIQVTLFVPNNQLELVNIKSPKSTVAIGSGFSVRHFTGVIANKAELHLYGLNADEAVLKITGYNVMATVQTLLVDACNKPIVAGSSALPPALLQGQSHSCKGKHQVTANGGYRDQQSVCERQPPLCLCTCIWGF